MVQSQIPSIFRSIAEKDHLNLFRGHDPNGQRIVDFLDYKKNDIQIAANVKKEAVRYDDKMPKALKERLFEWGVAINLVAGFFQDRDKTLLWFRTENPMLGGLSPRDMIRVGRFKKLLRFIQTALAENEK